MIKPIFFPTWANPDSKGSACADWLRKQWWRLFSFQHGHSQTQKFLHEQTDIENNDKASFLSNTGYQTQTVLHAQTYLENNSKDSFLSKTGYTQAKKVMHAQTNRETNEKAFFLSNTGIQRHKILLAQTDQQTNDKASFFPTWGIPRHKSFCMHRLIKITMITPIFFSTQA